MNNFKISAIFNFFLIAVGALLIGSFPAFAKPVQVMVKTTTGCSVSIDAPTLKVMTQDADNSVTWEWTGDCVSGVGNGAGVLRQRWKMGTGDFSRENITTQTGQMYQGLFYGFSKRENRNESTNQSMRRSFSPTYIFSFQDQQVGIAGLGLIASDAVLERAGNSTPVRGIDWSRDMISIGEYQLGTLMLMKAHCGLDKDRFPECGFGEGQQKYEVFRFTQFPPVDFSSGIPVFGKPIYTYCPNPRDQNSCVELASQLSKPYVEAIETFLITNLPKLKDIDGQVRTAGAELSKRRSDEAAARALASEQAAQADAKVRAELNARLDSANVGELFALADEFKSKGGKDNLLNARAALRKLISRFPDHKLATLSAQILTELQNTQ